MTRGSGRCGGRSQALHVPGFRALRAAEFVAVAGDQLARVGLGVRAPLCTPVADGGIPARAGVVGVEA